MRARVAVALLVAVGACGGGDDGAPSPDASTGALPSTCEGACRTLTLTARFGTVTAPFERAFYGLTRSATGTTVYIEATSGGDDACPSAASPVPDHLFRLDGFPVPASTMTLAADGGLADFLGDLLPSRPTALAASTTVTPVAADVCPACVGLPAPADPDGLLALDVQATFAGDAPGVIAGHVFATHCDALDTSE